MGKLRLGCDMCMYDQERYEKYECLACDLCKSCDHNTKEYVSEGLNGTSEKEYPFCDSASIHMIWMKEVLDGKPDCHRYLNGGMS